MADKLPKLKGTVVRITLRGLASGKVKHNTRIEFDPESSPYRSVVAEGTLPAEWARQDWPALMLDALNTRYDVGNRLPKPRWREDSRVQWDTGWLSSTPWSAKSASAPRFRATNEGEDR